MIGEEYERFVALAGELRPVIMDRVQDPDRRKRLWYEIVDSPVLGLLRDGAHAEAKALVLRLVDAAARESQAPREAASR